jgi:hypothetical protein
MQADTDYHPSSGTGRDLKLLSMHFIILKLLSDSNLCDLHFPHLWLGISSKPKLGWHDKFAAYSFLDIRNYVPIGVATPSIAIAKTLL